MCWVIKALSVISYVITASPFKEVTLPGSLVTDIPRLSQRGQAVPRHVAREGWGPGGPVAVPVPLPPQQQCCAPLPEGRGTIHRQSNP